MTYLMADIHGNLERFNSVMKQIKLKDEDTLYILGDVIDRFPGGVKILNKIMKMPNVKMILGNHEYMMLQALDNNYDLTNDKDKMLYKHYINQWYNNGGKVTHNSIKHISKESRAKIFEFLRTLPLNIDIEVNQVKYKLVHGSPLENYILLGNGRYLYDDEKEFTVWERWYEGDYIPKGYTLIFGHTPTVNYHNSEKWEIWKGENAIGIDCGSGYSYGRLGCLRLDDMKEFYSEYEEHMNLRWDVYREELNKNEFRKVNIFNHGRFFEAVQKLLKLCKSKEEFANRVRSELLYYFWSKSEYEVVITKKNGRIIMSPWISNNVPELDVTDDDNFDWLGFYDSLDKVKYNDKLKIDIYDQVMYQYEAFIDYVWNSYKRRKNKKE